MEVVMWDMLRAGEMLNGFILYRDTFTNAVQESQRWYQKIYELHGITKEEFIRSYEYYREHPDLSRALFDSLARYEEKQEPVDTVAVTPAVDTINQKGLDTSVIKEADTALTRKKPSNELVVDTTLKRRGSLNADKKLSPGPVPQRKKKRSS
ncbi:MAG: DUF4296 domain-containing protein [Chitinophagaceae bacterium]|nr:DUF4296 domain-containing protein [Chitinophagaceae bacterium]